MAWRYTYTEDDPVSSHSEDEADDMVGTRNGNGNGNSKPIHDDQSDLNENPDDSSTTYDKTEFSTPQFLFDKDSFYNSDAVQTIIMSCDGDDSNFEPEETTAMEYGNSKSDLKNAPFSLACRFCFSTFPTKEAVEAHVSKFHPEEDEDGEEDDHESNSTSTPKPMLNPNPVPNPINGLFTCEECGKNLSTLRTLREHSRIHTGEKPYACDYCPSVFGFRANLRRHIKFVHFQGKDTPGTISITSDSDQTASAYSRFICRTCGQVFTTSAYLKRHLKTHITQDKRNFPCPAPLCKKRFNDKPSLRVHMSTHTGEKSFVCEHPGCGKKFTTKQACVLHGKIQHQFGAPSSAMVAGPFTCSECNRTCPSLVSLKIHVMNYHPGVHGPQGQGQGQSSSQHQSLDVKPFSAPGAAAAETSINFNNGLSGRGSISVSVGVSGSNNSLSRAGQGQIQNQRPGPSNTRAASSLLRSMIGMANNERASAGSAGQSTSIIERAGAGQSTTSIIERAGASISQIPRSNPFSSLRTIIGTSNNLRSQIHAANNQRASAAAAAASLSNSLRTSTSLGAVGSRAASNSLRGAVAPNSVHNIQNFHNLRTSVIGPHNTPGLGHMRPGPPQLQIPIGTIGRPRQYLCDEPECGKSYVSAQGLRHHKLMMHSGTKKTPHVCRQCGQGFLRRWVLRAHLKTHTNEKEANFCSLCNEGYERHRAHLRSPRHVQKLREAGVGVGAGGQMEVKAEADMDDEWVGEGEGEGEDDNDDWDGQGDGDDMDDNDEWVGQGQGQDDDEAEIEYDYDIEEVETDEYGNPI